MCVCVFIIQRCLTLDDPMDCGPRSSSVHGILQARILQWVAVPFSKLFGELLCVWRMGWSCGSSVCCRSWLQGTPASVAAARGLSSRGSRAPEHMLTSCGAVASLRGGMWDPLGLETEPVSPALAGRFFTTELPGKPPT